MGNMSNILQIENLLDLVEYALKDISEIEFMEWDTVSKIYIPNKSAMQSGLGKIDKWILEFETNDPTKNPLMGWESSNDTYTELKLEFSTKELAINYAKKKKIDYELIEPKKRKMVKKSYADNFLK